MSDRLKNPVECADCGRMTDKPSMGRNAEPLCPVCTDVYNKAVGVLAGEAANGGVK